jgi:pilus assembly protein CpaB
MNNNVLKVIAGVLALGAVIVAFLGVRLSGQPEPTPAPVAVERRQPVLVAARQVAVGQVLSAADVEVQQLPAASAPAGALQQVQQVVGQVSAQAIAKGAPILASFVAPESLSALLRPGERAVAVQVDEVVGVGGFARPGDHVDVLQFAGANRETGDTTFSQVVVSNARILTFGEASQIDKTSASPAPAGDATQDVLKESGAQAAVQARERRLNLRSAVLALREVDATRLMLAANTGQLRLSLRPKDATQVISAGSLANAAPGTATEAAPLSTRLADLSPVKPKPKASGAPAPESIIIQEGSKERRLARNEPAPQP